MNEINRRTSLAAAAALMLAAVYACNPPRESTAMGGNTATDSVGNDDDLTDAHIAHIALTANSGDSAMGVFARPRAQSGAVREFAALMVRDHGSANTQARELATRLNLTPMEHKVSRDLSEDLMEEERDLSDQTGREFDRDYIEHEVDLHDRLLKAIDDDLLPNADNAELRQLLTQTRATVAMHLEMARGIERTLGGRRATTAARTDTTRH